jgi:hypothetical protein
MFYSTYLLRSPRVQPIPYNIRPGAVRRREKKKAPHGGRAKIFILARLWFIRGLACDRCSDHDRKVRSIPQPSAAKILALIASSLRRQGPILPDTPVTGSVNSTARTTAMPQFPNLCQGS